MSAIRGWDVAEAIKDMEAEGKSGNTIRLHLAVLSHLFKVAKTEWGMEAISNPRTGSGGLWVMKRIACWMPATPMKTLTYYI
ncbi:hypothetical protein GL267_007330 [Acidithiobacillus ferrianus]|uniref:Core-binding (CB) domain-containing protein n=2 Tax=Acidithiobacillus ferrianus TaxID=2678518 RepID=A0A845UC05_9PROT|nr:hypothetical protein [Acidithiobacillus ferrianus]NDU43471.1 hypothetical protein [Acidithiobacillus ferrianus]